MSLITLSNQVNSTNWMNAILGNELSISSFVENFAVSTQGIHGDQSGLVRSKTDLDLESLVPLIVSEDVLARDWNTPEEDAAWQDL